MGCSYNTYSTNHLQYSIDGENYTTVATFNITGAGWFDLEDVELPQDADEQERIYIRWMPDRESELVGNSTDYDGLAISDVFITADAGALADEEAILVSSNPENGASGVSANGSIILTFDKKVKAGEGNATLDGEEITPIISGKTAIFKYAGLKYATDYTYEVVGTTISGHGTVTEPGSFKINLSSLDDGDYTLRMHVTAAHSPLTCVCAAESRWLQHPKSLAASSRRRSPASR